MKDLRPKVLSNHPMECRVTIIIVTRGADVVQDNRVRG